MTGLGTLRGTVDSNTVPEAQFGSFSAAARAPSAVRPGGLQDIEVGDEGLEQGSFSGAQARKGKEKLAALPALPSVAD